MARRQIAVRRMARAVLATLGAWLVRTWMGTLRVQCRCPLPQADPLDGDWDGNYVYVSWHEYLLLPFFRYRDTNTVILVSQSDDGDLLATVSKRLGWRPVRGSSTRGAVAALKTSLILAKDGSRWSIGITADGPKGPHRELKNGCVFLASKLRKPIALVGMAFDRPWRARTWDRFAVPRPFSRAALIIGTPIDVPYDLDRDQLEAFRLRVEAELHNLSTQAENMLNEDGRNPLPRARIEKMPASSRVA